MCGLGGPRTPALVRLERPHTRVAMAPPCALCVHQVVAVESNQAAVDRGLGMIKTSLDVIAKKAVAKEGVAEAAAKVG